MTDWRDRVTTAPLWVLFLESAIYFAAALYLLGGRPWPLGAAVAGLFFGASMTIFVAINRRGDRTAADPGGIRDPASFARALRTGEAPGDLGLDRSLMGLIARRREQLRKASKVSPWFFGSIVVMGLISALVEHSYPSLAYPVGVGALMIYRRRASVRSHARLDRLESEIRMRSK